MRKEAKKARNAGFESRRNCKNKGFVLSNKARKRFAGGDTSAGRPGMTRMESRPLFFAREK